MVFKLIKDLNQFRKTAIRNKQGNKLKQFILDYLRQEKVILPNPSLTKLSAAIMLHSTRCEHNKHILGVQKGIIRLVFKGSILVNVKQKKSKPPVKFYKEQIPQKFACFRLKIITASKI